MESSISLRGVDNWNPPIAYTFSEQSKIAILAFTVAGVAGIIIITLSALGIFGIVRSAGYIAAISGGGVSICLSSGGIIWLIVINCKKHKNTDQKDISFTKNIKGVIATDASNTSQNKKRSDVQLLNIASKSSTPNNLSAYSASNGKAKDIGQKESFIYGPTANVWKKLNVEIVDEVTDVPKISQKAKDPYFNALIPENYALIYIPKRVRINGEEKDFNLRTLQEIFADSFKLNEHIDREFGEHVAPGWVLVSKRVIPDSIDKDYYVQQAMIEKEKGFRMPSVLELATLRLMALTSTNERLYDYINKYDPKYDEKKKSALTRCKETMMGGILTFTVGCIDGADNDDDFIHYVHDRDENTDFLGMAVAKTF